MITRQLPRLTSNGFEIKPERLGFLQPTQPNQSRDVLWAQFQEQGYLWLKGLLDREAVLDFRERVFTAFKETGFVSEEASPRIGLDSGVETFKVHPNKLLMEMVRWATFEAFCLSKPIVDFYEWFLEGAVYLHKRKIMRYNRPHESASTGPHYDLTYLRGGTDSVCTSWIPLGDIPVEMGGLTYLENSDKRGRETEAEFSRRNADLKPEERISAYNKNMGEGGWLDKNLMKLAEKWDTRWLIADYEAGDMVVHSAYMIHAATQNIDPQNRLRLSIDIRYQRVRDEIDVRWANHWTLEDML
jgi:ectoine hydroxylase-related dioxygenase (phytanoyl-CoA dioxygenase family)